MSRSNQSQTRPPYVYRGRGRGRGFTNASLGTAGFAGNSRGGPRLRGAPFNYNNSSGVQSQALSPTTAQLTVPGRELTEGLVLDKVVATIPVPSSVAGVNAEISDVECIGSYSWLKETETRAETGGEGKGEDQKETRCIIVPGSPPEWTNQPTPYTVPTDTAERCIDHNCDKLPTAPLLPLIASVDSYQATVKSTVFDWSSIDIVTDRNGLRRLLRWVRRASGEEPTTAATAAQSPGRINAQRQPRPWQQLQPQPPWQPSRDFRIDLQLAGKTVLFSRWEERTKEPPRFSGTFGFNFERVTTREAKGCKGADGHHRIMQYDFGGLKMVVRCGVDACTPVTTRGGATVTTSTHQASNDRALDELASAMSKASITTPRPPRDTDDSQPVSEGETALNVCNLAGSTTMPPQSSLIELATISQWRFDHGAYDWEEVAMQMLISQTPHLYLGIHNKGHFQEVKKKSFEESVELQRAEAKVKPSLRKLRTVLGEIKKLVVEHGEEGRLSLVCKDEELKVYQRNSDDSCLPTDLLDEFL